MFSSLRAPDLIVKFMFYTQDPRDASLIYHQLLEIIVQLQNISIVNSSLLSFAIYKCILHAVLSAINKGSMIS